MNSTIAIVQVRMNSQRLPGKALMPLAGLPLLQMLLLRLGRAKSVDRLVVATSTAQNDDTVASMCKEMDIACVRGSEDDVLGRFIYALEEHPATSAVRVCADNPLTDPALVDDLIKHFYRGDFDYAYNNLPECGYPDGVGAEIVSAKILRQVAHETQEPHAREHVTLHIKRHPSEFRIGRISAPEHLHHPEIRLDVDYPEDLRFLRTFCEVLPPASMPFWTTAEFIAAAESYPEIMQLRNHSILT